MTIIKSSTHFLKALLFILVLFILVLMSGNNLFAREHTPTKLNQVELTQQLNRHLGESNFDHYYGPNNPIILINKYNQDITFKDDYEKELYFNSKVQNELFYLKQFLDVEMSVGMFCPDYEYRKVDKYFQYLSRLVTISYLHEALRKYEYTSKQMSFSNTCNTNWTELFNSCQGKSKDMKLFLKNTKHILGDLAEIIVPFEETTSKSKSRWFQNYNKGHFSDLSQYRISEHCSGKKCQRLNQKGLNKSLSQICHDDSALLRKICSEEDHLYGASYAPEIYQLLSQSSALRAVGTQEFSSGCLRRFIKNNQKKEILYTPLKGIFSYLYSEFSVRESQYERGQLFAVGSLKEFMDKGLVSIFEEEIQTVIPVAQVKIETKMAPEMSKIELPKFKKTKIIKAVRSKRKAAKKKKKVQRSSSFLVASMFRDKFKLDQVRVDMGQFKYDYIFTLKQGQELSPIISKFSSQKSLKDMLHFDKLGSHKAPIPLRFLKFLIDKEMHQGIYNIINVIGDSFYVQNDIDKNIKKVEYIKIQNDQNTHFRWELSVVKDKILSKKNK